MLLLLALLGLGVLVFLNVLFMPHGLLERDWGPKTDGDVIFYDPGSSCGAD